MEDKDLLEQEKIKDQEEVKDVPAENVPAEETPAQDTPVEGDTDTPESGNDEAATEDESAESIDEPVEEAQGTEGEAEGELEPEAEPEPEKMLTQSQVNELVGKARAEGRASAMKELYGRYGVNDDNELNDIFGRGQGYELLNDEFNNLSGKYKDMSAENALLKSKIVPNRWEDVKAILSTKGLEINPENIEAEIITHPEWREVLEAAGAEGANTEISPERAEQLANQLKLSDKVIKQESPSTIKKLGSDIPEPKIDEDDIKAMKMFGLKN